MTIGKHGNDEFRTLAEDGTILRALVGSGVHGISIEGTDDRDEIGVCIEPPQYVVGLSKFEQYENHTAWQRTGSLRARSGPGDLDIVIYSLRKYVRLALAGNPTILTLFFVGDDAIVQRDRHGRSLQNMHPVIVSREAGPRYLGYLHAQRTRMLRQGGKGKDVSRPELMEKYGFDTKFAGHMIRLGYQGIELLRTGSLTLPMPAEEREHVKAIRTGEFSLAYCLNLAEQLETAIGKLINTSPLPMSPDRDMVNNWLIDTYTEAWLDRERI